MRRRGGTRFFVCVVLFKRQLLYFIKSFCLCQELFYFSLSLFSSFPLPSHATAYLGYHFQNSLSTTFLIYFSQVVFQRIKGIKKYLRMLNGEGGI